MIPKKLPANLKKIVILIDSIDNLCDLNVLMKMGVEIKVILSIEEGGNIIRMPEGITKLKINNFPYEKNIKSFPKTLKSIAVNFPYTSRLDFPEGLIYLKLDRYCAPGRIEIPSSIEYLRLPNFMLCRIYQLPGNLKRLVLIIDPNEDDEKIKLPKTNAIISYLYKVLE